MRSVQSAAAFWALPVSLLPAPALPPPWPPMHSMERLTRCVAATVASLSASRCSKACVCVCVCARARMRVLFMAICMMRLYMYMHTHTIDAFMSCLMRVARAQSYRHQRRGVPE